jgi:ABC-type dipeptide/oligopeptide/nickel transport system permease component
VHRILTFIIRRLLVSIPVVLALVFAVFALMRAIPGGPFDFENDTSLPPSVIANLQKKYHIDKPFGRQFVRYVAGQIVDTGNLADLGKGGLLRGDLGVAFRERGRTVNEIVAAAFPVSLQLGLMSLGMALLLGVPLGVIAAAKHNTWVDYACTFVAVIGVSLPALVLGPLMQWLFALKLNLLPVATWGASPPFVMGFIPVPNARFWTHALLPVLTLGSALAAGITRLTRASLLQVLSEDYVRTARAKGLREMMVIWRHALKNGAIPVVTVLGPILAHVVTGTFVIEQIFGIPGLGRYFVRSIGNRDYSVIQGLTLLYAVLLVAANLLVDICYAWLDPRIRYE